MRKLWILLGICSVSFHLNAQKAMTSQDSIKVFYDKLLTLLKSDYVYKKDVDWKAVGMETNQNLKGYSDFKSSLAESGKLFGKIKATHCKIIYKDKVYGTTLKASTDHLSEQWKEKYATKPGFEVKVLDGKWGYILMPGIKSLDFSAENTHKTAQPMYDQIAAVKTKNKLEGWIIDLRFNTGGNSAPMLLSLYDFLGDNDIWGTVDRNQKQNSKVKLEKGKYLSNAKKTSSIDPEGELLDQAKVAVIIGQLTASSGEVTALAFKGRPDTVFIGEKTFGMTTANVDVALPFSSTLILSVALDTDRNGKYYDQIVPDIAVSGQDNFHDLLADKNVQEAISFISKK
ncbi:peptidase S41 protein [Chryseobacterium shigense]|uniref:Peptidase family S41 n=1 Tax=Chryseobacterium shigense TaxID=297244 RepID=A0A1N7HXY8_9FLAO|nr:S41 family peptidase [Chryseobacterium shigense]PQA94000.1 peptidase S41 protein [Chryseobacterium shigense]SIS29590.1 Peptidase family S41 [Chryseobacterium shigense]